MRTIWLSLVMLAVCERAATAQTDCRAWLDEMRAAFSSLKSPQTETGCLGGVVLDEDGKPMVFAEVYLAPRDPSLRAKLFGTGDGGRFCTSVSPGLYLVSFAKSGYARTGDRAFYPDGPLEVSVPASGSCVELKGRLARTSKLILKPQDAQTGEPVQYALRVGFGRSFDFRSQKEVSTGKAFEVPSRGPLNLKIGALGYETEEFSIQTKEPGETQEFEFTLRPAVPGCVMGTVADDHKHPTAGAFVGLSPVSFFQNFTGAKSGADGKFKASVYPGTYRVSVAKKSDGYVDDWEETPEVTIGSSSQCEELNVSLPSKAAWVVVHLVDATSHLPVSGDMLLTNPETGKRHAHAVSENDTRPDPVPANTQMTIQAWVTTSSGQKAAEQVTLPPLAPGQTTEITMTFP